MELTSKLWVGPATAIKEEAIRFVCRHPPPVFQSTEILLSYSSACSSSVTASRPNPDGVNFGFQQQQGRV